MAKKGQPKKKKKRKLRIKVILKILFFLIIVVSLTYYIFNLKIKNINIIGNKNVKDVTIIEKAGIKDYPEIYKLNTKKIEKNINTIPLITKTQIKRNLFGKITIEVEESKILFFYKYNNKYITSSNDSIENTKDYYGYPTLINFTPDTIFDSLVNGLTKIDYDIVKMINEIEYTPYKVEDGTIIDNNLFTLRMNDGNTIMIDTVNIKNLNKYKTIYASLGLDSTKGIIHLDTIIDEKMLFKSYDSIIEEEKNKEKEEITENE